MKPTPLLLTLGGTGSLLAAARWSGDRNVILAGAPWQAWRAPSSEEIAAAETKEKKSSSGHGPEPLPLPKGRRTGANPRPDGFASGPANRAASWNAVEKAQSMRPTSSFILLIALAFTGSNAVGQPTITSHPTNQSVSLGANVTFQVRATGTQPLNFQWRLNHVDIPEGITNSLALTNVQLLHAGDYTAVVTDASGSVTSRVATLQVDPTFTKITTGTIATEGSASTACAWGDYDNDGWPDLFVNNRDARNFLYRNQRDGTFEKIKTGHLVTNTVTHLAGVWGDYDNDGYLDMLVVNGGCCAGAQQNFLYHNNRDGTFSQPSPAVTGSIVTDAGGFHGAAWGDYDGDGFLDVFVANYTGNNQLYRNRGGTNFLGTAKPGANCVEGTWADYDNDGDLDLVLAQFGGGAGPDMLYRNDGHGLLTRTPAGTLLGEGASSSGISWSDYDNDGFFDLFVSNFPGGHDLLYHNRGDGTFEKIVQSALVDENADTYGPAWGDYDNDGFLDLFVANGFIGGGSLDNSLFHNNGDGTFKKILTGSLANDQGHSIACAWADYDKDGFLDLFVANDPNFDGGAPEINFLYRNNGNANNWLEIRCVGTVSNRDGIGAKVRVKAHYAGQDRWQLRQIASSDGRTGGSLEAHFGLGDATNADLVRIEWPSGTVQELHDVASGLFHTVTEPGGEPQLVPTRENGQLQLTLTGKQGSRYDIETSTDLTNWNSLLNFTVTVTDPGGTVTFPAPGEASDTLRLYRAALK